MTGEYQKWLSKLLGYDFVIEYKKGLDNGAAYALLRLPKALELNTLSFVQGINTAVFSSQVDQDAQVSKKSPSCEGWGSPSKRILYSRGLLLYKNQLVLPPLSPTIALLPQEFHNNLVRGHHGVVKMYQ